MERDNLGGTENNKRSGPTKRTYPFSPDAFAIAYPNSHQELRPPAKWAFFCWSNAPFAVWSDPPAAFFTREPDDLACLLLVFPASGIDAALAEVSTISTHQIASGSARSRSPDSPPAAPPFVLGRGVMFNELSDVEWHALRDLICDRPVRTERRGRPQVEQRTLTNAVLWVLFTGESWSKLPMQYPSVPTCRRKLNEWRESGMLDTILKRLQQSGRDISACAGQISKPARSTPCGDTDRLRGVFWTNPASWKPPVAVR